MPENVELKEAQDKLEAADAKIAELEEGVVQGEADKTELTSFREKEIVRAAAEAVAENLKDTDMIDEAKARLVEALSKNPPTKDGELDKEALATQTQEAATAEAEYLERITGSGSIRGMASGDGEADTKKLEESVRAAHRDWSDEMVANYING